MSDRKSTLDHAIALARGSTIAPETTCVQLQRAKAARRLSLGELREEKLRQWERQESENRFYHTCLDIFCDLAATVINVAQTLSLQDMFEPEINPVGDHRVLQTVQTLRTALERGRSSNGKSSGMFLESERHRPVGYDLEEHPHIQLGQEQNNWEGHITRKIHN